MEFTIIDGVVAIVVVLSAILAYGRGLVREIMAIVGWVIAAFVAYIFAPQVNPLMSEIPVLRDLVGDNCDLSILSAFFIVFAVALIIVSIFTPLFASAVQRSALGGIDQGLGFLFGVARGVLLVAIAFFVYDTVVTGESYTIVDESRSAEVFGQFATQIQEQNPQEALGWVTDQYQTLIGVCEAE
ncbi:MAG: CvpA family protein [Pseudomonadota bacterium]